MINIKQVYDFCNQLNRSYGVSFSEQQTMGGLLVTGGYCTLRGSSLTLSLTLYANKIAIRIHDASKRIIFTDSCTSDINSHMRLQQFIHNSVTSR